MQHAATTRENARGPTPPCGRPRKLNRRAQDRFVKLRAAYWMSLCGPEPTPRQATMVDSIAQLEWGVEVARALNTPMSLREMRENLRLRDRLVLDLERSVREAAAAAQPIDPMEALNAYLARRTERAEEGDEAA